MYEGFQMKQKYNEGLHLETLRLLRHLGLTQLATTPTKKGYKVPKPYNYYPLPYDQKGIELSHERLIEIKSKKDSVIENGKLRGYADKDGNLFNKEDTQIGYYLNGVIEYIN